MKKNCKYCDSEMIEITEDEGGLVVLWCDKCGTLGTVMIGEEEVDFTKVGEKPSWLDG